MGFWDKFDPTGHLIQNVVGKIVDATSDKGDTQSGLTDTPAKRKAWMDKVMSRPGGKKKLAYFLKNAGYDMSIAGPDGFKWAAHGFQTLGDAPDQVNKYNLAWARIKRPNPNGKETPAQTPARTPAPAGAGGAADTTVDPLAQLGLTDTAAAGSGTDYGALLNGVNPKTAALLNPRQYAKNQAGLAFDPKIAELSQAQRRLAPQAAQDLANIGSWYKQVGAQQDLGITAGKVGTDAALANVNSVATNLAQAAGGNETAAGLTAAAGTAGAGSIAAIGASSDALANRLKELTSLEGKTRGIDEQRYQEKLRNDMALELSNTKGQKGAAIADALSKALTFNNEARQTNFANRLSTIQTQIGADAAGLDLQKAQLGLEGDKVDLAGKILTYKQAVAEIKSGGRVYWNKMAPEARAGLVNATVNAVLGKKGNPINSRDATRKKAYSWAVQTAGINNPAFRARVNAELARRFPKQFA